MVMMKGSWMEVVTFAGMALAELADVGIATVSKAAMSKGMSPFVYAVYTNALGTLFLFLPFIFYRPKNLPLTFKILGAFFLLGSIGYTLIDLHNDPSHFDAVYRTPSTFFVTHWMILSLIGIGQVIWYTGIRYSSPTLSSAMANLVPAFIFVLAIIFRMEKLDLRTSSSQAKVIGAVVSITGAFIVTLYKGTPIIISTTPPSPSNLSSQSNWVIGGFLLSICCVLIAVWFIIQAAVIKEYPSETTVMFFYSLFGTIQCAIISFIIETDPNAWKLKSGLELTAVAIAAVFGCVFRTGVHIWGIHKKGPVYVAMFKPLGIVFAAIMSVAFLGDTLYIGSVVGAFVIVSGFYAVMREKAKEEMMEKKEYGVVGNSESFTVSDKAKSSILCKVMR